MSVLFGNFVLYHLVIHVTSQCRECLLRRRPTPKCHQGPYFIFFDCVVKIFSTFFFHEWKLLLKKKKFFSPFKKNRLFIFAAWLKRITAECLEKLTRHPPLHPNCFLSCSSCVYMCKNEILRRISAQELIAGAYAPQSLSSSNREFLCGEW